MDLGLLSLNGAHICGKGAIGGRPLPGGIMQRKMGTHPVAKLAPMRQCALNQAMESSKSYRSVEVPCLNAECRTTGLTSFQP